MAILILMPAVTGFEEVVRLRGPQIVSNDLNSDGLHTAIAILENQGTVTERYRKVNCQLLVGKEERTCDTCKKLRNTMITIRNRYLAGVKSAKSMHSSTEVLSMQIKDARKVC
jgi:hypothetical protein